MAPTVVSSIAQPTPQLSTMRSSSLSVSQKNEESKTRSPNVTAGVAVDSKSDSVDTVRISFQALQSSSDVKRDEAKSEVKKDEARKIEAKKEKVGDTNNNIKPEAATAKVQFVYNQRGDLITKYLDSSGSLIYQVPSKLMLLSQEADSKSKSKSISSFDTRV
ncbi:MAG: hypothetical protein ACOYL3_23685 [Desulfuromonadaceae bacterium]